jgi:hypothetical protein
VPLRVLVHAVEGGAAAARKPRQTHVLPAAGEEAEHLDGSWRGHCIAKVDGEAQLRAAPWA